MKFALSSLLLLSTLTFSLAKEEKAKETVETAKVETDKDAPIPEPLTDGSGAKSEGASSDFDIEKLLKLIDALKNNDFDEVDKALKNDSEDHGMNFKKFDHLDEEEIDGEKSGKKAEKKESKTPSAASETDLDEELAKMEL